MRTQLSPIGSEDDLRIELSSNNLARIDYKSFKGDGSIVSVGSKTSAKQRRKEDKRDQFIEIDNVELVYCYDNNVSNKIKANKLCKSIYKQTVITLAQVKKLWNDLKSGKIVLYYNGITGEVEV